jgi:hypothetical protein
MRSTNPILIVLLAALAAYVATALAVGRTQTQSLAYFDALADSFLRGRLYLDPPPGTVDLTEHAGRWYVPFPPLPALLMLPWRALGLPIHSVWFSVLLAALNVALVYRLMCAVCTTRPAEIGHEATRLGGHAARPSDQETSAGGGRARANLESRGAPTRRRHHRGLGMPAASSAICLTVLFALGTAHWYAAVDGQVWFLSHICALTFVLLAAVAAAERRSAWIVGILLGVAMLARPHVMLTWPLLLALGVFGWSYGEDRASPAAAGLAVEGARRRLARARVRWVATSLAGPLIAAALLLAYNHARFADPLNFGYAAQNVGAEVRGDLLAFGQFHPRFIRRNLYYMWIATPLWDAHGAALVPDHSGMGLLLTTPAILLIAALRRGSALAAGAAISLGLLLIPLLLYYNTGWRQFGYRFGLDFIVPMLVLLALATRGRFPILLPALTLAGIAVNAWGLMWWFRVVA